MNNDRNQLLKKIQVADFTVDEAILYLDGHPTNKLALSFFEKATKECDDLIAKYETTYGPLDAHHASGPSWTWIQGPWPWQHESEV